MEFYSARLASKNDFPRFKDHWRKEAEDIIKCSLVATLLHEIRGVRDRRKPIEQALREAKSCDLRCRNGVENYFKKVYKLEVKRHLNESDSKAFWKLVDREIGPFFNSLADIN